MHQRSLLSFQSFQIYVTSLNTFKDVLWDRIWLNRSHLFATDLQTGNWRNGLSYVQQYEFVAWRHHASYSYVTRGTVTWSCNIAAGNRSSMSCIFVKNRSKVWCFINNFFQLFFFFPACTITISHINCFTGEFRLVSRPVKNGKTFCSSLSAWCHHLKESTNKDTIYLSFEKRKKTKASPSESFGRRNRSWQKFRTFVWPFLLLLLMFPSTAQSVVLTARTDSTQSLPRRSFGQNFSTFRRKLESSVEVNYFIYL